MIRLLHQSLKGHSMYRTIVVFVCLASMTSALAAQESIEPTDEPVVIDSEFVEMMAGARAVVDALEDIGPLQVEADTSGEPLTLSVQEAVQLALLQNPIVLRTAADVAALEARIDQARSELFPQVSADVGYNYQEGASDSFRQGFFTNLIVPGGADVKDWQRRDRIGVQQLIWAGGSVRAAIRASRYLAESEAWRRAAALDDLEYQTKQAYYDALATRALVSVAEDSVRTFDRHLRDTELMLEVGETSPVERVRAETELGARRSDLIVAGNRVRLAHTNLRRLLNVPQHTPLVLTDRFNYFPLPEDVQKLIEQAKSNRPELLSLARAIAAGEEDVKRVRGTYWPRAAGSVDRVNLDGAGNFTPDGWQATIGLEWDIYVGGRRKAEKAEARAQVDSLEWQYEEVEALVEAEVLQAYIQVQDAIARIRSEQGNLELAEEGLRLERLRFQEGVGIQAQVLDAELAFRNAETQLVQALREYGVAHAALDRAIGNPWFGRNADLLEVAPAAAQETDMSVEDAVDSPAQATH